MALFNPTGWRYYLPAYLISSIRDEDYRTTFFSPGDHLEERLRYLNIDQFKALTAYILIVLKFESIERITYRSYQKQLSYWKAKYKEVVGEEIETE